VGAWMATTGYRQKQTQQDTEKTRRRFDFVLLNHGELRRPQRRLGVHRKGWKGLQTSKQASS
jgi:hypothetical protein